MSDALLRQWELLRAIPRAPGKVDVSALNKKLEQLGYQITRRQLQRDLNNLSRIFNLESDERSVPYGWSWSRQAAVLDLPAMDAPTALMLKLIEQFIPHLLPPTLNDYLGGYFAKAETVLRDYAPDGLERWRKKIRVVPREMPLLPPKTDADTTRVVYQALLDEKRFTAEYTPRGTDADSNKSYEVNPLGIVVRGNLVYLVCTLWDYQDIRQLALHRIKRAEMIDKPVTQLPRFDLDEYIKQGEFQYPVGSMIKLKAIFDREAASHLYETPLSEDQVIEDVDAGRVVVTATVQDTQQLMWWLLGFGEEVVVVDPKNLSSRLESTLRFAHEKYGNSYVYMENKR